LARERRGEGKEERAEVRYFVPEEEKEKEKEMKSLKKEMSTPFPAVARKRGGKGGRG